MDPAEAAADTEALAVTSGVAPVVAVSAAVGAAVAGAAVVATGGPLAPADGRTAGEAAHPSAVSAATAMTAIKRRSFTCNLPHSDDARVRPS
jgi:hypothetical protein